MMKIFSYYFSITLILMFTNIGYADIYPGEDSNQWVMLFDAGIGDTSTAFCSSSFFGVLSTSIDNYDGDNGSDSLIFAPNPAAVFAATYHSDISDGWTGAGGFYGSDMHKPIETIPGTRKSWLIYVWATPEVLVAATDINLYVGRFEPEFLPLDHYSFNLTLVSKPQGVTSGPSAGTTWKLGPAGIDLQLPMYRTDNGLTGYLFEFSATAVPEPSSLLALFTGLAGIGGIVWRRMR